MPAMLLGHMCNASCKKLLGTNAGLLGPDRSHGKTSVRQPHNRTYELITNILTDDALGKLEKTPIPIPKGKPGSQALPYPVVYGSKKAETLLGFKPRDLATVCKDTLESLEARGFLATKA